MKEDILALVEACFDQIYWLCNTCEASDRGSPVDLLED